MPDDPAAPTRATVAAVRYLNTCPLIEGLDESRDCTLQLAAPSAIAGMVRSGKADVGLCSIIDAAGDPDLTVLRCGMIGCDGPTLTVRLYSKTPIGDIERVHADTDSHTSVALSKVLLHSLSGRIPEFVDFDARERVERRGGAAVEWPDALLMIGDKVVTDSPPAVRYPHQLDLGQAWREHTGHPFVYAAWMCRSVDAERPDTHAIATLLDRQRRHNATRMDWLVRTRAPEFRWPVDLAKRYLGELLRFELGDRERAAATLFAQRAAEIGAAPGPTLRWSEAKE